MASILPCAATLAGSLYCFGPGVDKIVQAIDDVIADHKHADGSTARVVVRRVFLICGTTWSSFVDIFNFPVFAQTKNF